MIAAVRHAAILALASSVVLLVSCEAIVSDTVPQFTCQGTSPEACPQGQYCNGSGCKTCETQDVCDHLDNDCNGKVDDGKLCDADGDGFTWCGQLDANGKPIDVDCDDNDPKVYPGAPEICDGKDNDCNGIVDDNATCQGTNTVCVAGKCVQNPCDPDGGTCPVNQYCDPLTRTCVSKTTLDIGAACTADTECTAPYFCADASVLGSTVLPVTGKGMCTAACCSSMNCPGGFVCYDAGTGGRFCVDPTKLGRSSSLGSEPAGTSESSADRCRSGVIANGKCIDTCCSDGDCSGGTACAFGTMNGHDGLYCEPGTGSGQQWSDCSNNGNADCHDSVCLYYGFFTGNKCIDECCSTSSCGTLGGLPARCYYEQSTNGDYVPLCSETQVGNNGLGSSCSGNNDCQSGVCYSDLVKNQKYCTDACCVDDDCGAGWACRPSPTLPRCVKK